MISKYKWRLNNPEKRTLHRRRCKVKQVLRKRGFLPPLGEELNEEHKKIYDQINNYDYTFWDSVKKNKKPGKVHNGGIQKNSKKYKHRSNEELLWIRVRDSAKNKEMEFNIDVNDIIIPTYCPLLNIKLTFNYLESKDSYYTLDRIDSSKGYVKGNVQVLSYKANTMKNSATKQELLIFAKNIINLLKS